MEVVLQAKDLTINDIVGWSIFLECIFKEFKTYSLIEINPLLEGNAYLKVSMIGMKIKPFVRFPLQLL